MPLDPKVFAGANGRFDRFEKPIRAQEVIGESLNDLFGVDKNKIKVREGEEHDLSLLIGAAIGKGMKTFQAISRLCLLGYGEDALILLRSNINLLINIGYILSRENPNDVASDFIAYSYEERVNYLRVAHGINEPPWKPNMSEEEHKRRVKSWKANNIAKRAENISELSPYKSHHLMGYKLFSSFEHSDAVALHAYIKDWDETGPHIGSGPSDMYIDIALVQSFAVMVELIWWFCKYFGINRPDILAKLQATLADLTRQEQTPS